MQISTKHSNKFWTKVNKLGQIQPHCLDIGPCWEWLGSSGDGRYGQFYIGKKPIKAHRLAWILVRGDIGFGMLVLHKCDNTKCVNPNHLFLGTNNDNSKDMVAKNRQNPPSGNRSGSAKLTLDLVSKIRALSLSGLSQKDIALKFMVSQGSISRVLRHKTWV